MQALDAITENRILESNLEHLDNLTLMENIFIIDEDNCWLFFLQIK